MRYAVEPRERRLVKGYGFLSIARDLGSKLLKPAGEATKTIAKRALNKTAEATGDLIGNKIADKIAYKSAGSKEQKKPEEKTITIPPNKRQQIIDELRLIPETLV